MIPLRIALAFLFELLAPVVTLVYRGGWFNTPDNPVSPHGLYEPFIRSLNAKWGTYISDWWWLGLRNRAYGLKYALKPGHFKQLSSYSSCHTGRKYLKHRRITTIDGFSETVWDFRTFHVIYGYRLTPIFNEIVENHYRRIKNVPLIPFRRCNMDARPIFSIRTGRPD